ncbi:hypothetical protein ACOMHN_020054 [Nucella lapillus]
MVEKSPKYRATFNPMPNRVGLLGGMAPYGKTDVTNPRELYSMLSENRPQRTLLTSVKVSSQAGAKLPPLDLSEMPFESLKKQTQYRSYPDLATCRSEKATSSDPLMPVRRSSSLQDLHSSLQLEATGTQTKKLKPILRDHKAKNGNDHNREKAGVKFGQKEVHLITDSPLPPISDRVGYVSSAKGGLSFSFPLEDQQQEEGNDSWILNHSPRHHHHHHRRHGAEYPSDIFPRGQPVEVKKPGTPTFEDYPEAYWELRSPTVQVPSDLKDGMIDRDRYRLQQISSLRLRAMNRELIANKLDTYRKWQQQMLAAQAPSPAVSSKQDSVRNFVTPTMTGPAPSARNGKQSRTSMNVQSDSLAVAATTINPNYNPLIKKRLESRKIPGHAINTDSYLAEDELRRRQKIEAAARGENGVEDDSEGKPVKVTVVNLSIDPDQSSHSPTSEVYTGIRKITFGPRPLSNKAKTQNSLQVLVSEPTTIPKAPGSASVASHNATLGSSQSHRGLASAPSVPTHSVGDGSTVQGKGDTTTDADSSVASKHTLKRFNKLRVFSEKHPFEDSTTTAAEPKHSTATRPNPPAAEKTPYLPQSRPQTYKLDLRNYPTRHLHNGFLDPRGRLGEEMGVLREGVDGFPGLLTADERGGKIGTARLGNPSPTKSETSSVSIRFSNGEVIVSKHGKRPNAP